MFNVGGLTKGLSFIKIISGLSRTLQIANQIIPLYQKAKPALSNAKEVLNILKEMNKPTNDKHLDTENTAATSLQKEKTPVTPTFFL